VLLEPGRAGFRFASLGPPSALKRCAHPSRFELTTAYEPATSLRVRLTSSRFVSSYRRTGPPSTTTSKRNSHSGKVDHERHAGLLDMFGIDPQELIVKAKGFLTRSATVLSEFK